MFFFQLFFLSTFANCANVRCLYMRGYLFVHRKKHPPNNIAIWRIISHRYLVSCALEVWRKTTKILTWKNSKLCRGFCLIKLQTGCCFGLFISNFGFLFRLNYQIVSYLSSNPCVCLLDRTMAGIPFPCFSLLYLVIFFSRQLTVCVCVCLFFLALPAMMSDFILLYNSMAFLRIDMPLRFKKLGI